METELAEIEDRINRMMSVFVSLSESSDSAEYILRCGMKVHQRLLA